MTSQLSHYFQAIQAVHGTEDITASLLEPVQFPEHFDINGLNANTLSSYSFGQNIVNKPSQIFLGINALIVVFWCAVGQKFVCLLNQKLFQLFNFLSEISFACVITNNP